MDMPADTPTSIDSEVFKIENEPRIRPIPLDIIECIADYVEDTADLASLVLVSRSLHAVCTPLLYSHIVIPAPLPETESVGLKRERLLSTLQCRPDLAKHVQSVHWTIVRTTTDSDPSPLIGKQLASVRQAFLGMCRNKRLTIAFIEDIPLSSQPTPRHIFPRLDQLASFIPWRNLDYLAIIDVAFSPRTLIIPFYPLLNQVGGLRVLLLKNLRLDTFAMPQSEPPEFRLGKLVLESSSSSAGQHPIQAGQGDGQDVISVLCSLGLEYLTIDTSRLGSNLPFAGISIKTLSSLRKLQFIASVTGSFTFTLSKPTWTGFFAQLPNLEMLELDYSNNLYEAPIFPTLLANIWISPDVCPALKSYALSAPIIKANIGTQFDMVVDAILDRMVQSRPQLLQTRFEFTLSRHYHEEAASPSLVQQILEARMQTIADRGQGQTVVRVKCQGSAQVVFEVSNGQWSSHVFS